MSQEVPIDRKSGTLVQTIVPKPRLLGLLKDLWIYRRVLWSLCRRDIRGKYKQATLGVTWAFVQPIAQVAVFTLAFKGVAKVETPIPYPIFALAALLPFNLFQQIVTLGTPSFVNLQSIVTKVYFPRLYAVLASCASALVNASITLAVLIVSLLVYRQSLTPWVLMGVPLLIAILMLAIGTASLLATINARFRDVQHILPLVMTALLYVSPVLYPLESMPASARTLASVNPVSGLVEGFRSAMTGQPPQSWSLIGYACLIAVVVFVVGVMTFERAQSKLIDVL